MHLLPDKLKTTSSDNDLTALVRVTARQKSSLGGYDYDETAFLPLQHGHQPGGKVRQLAKDHLHGVLHSGRQPSVRSKNDSVHTHPRPFLWFLHRFGVCIVLFVIDVIIVMYIVPHFAQTSRGFSKKIFTLVKCTKHFPYILAVSPITFRRTIKRASFPHGKDALFRELIGA